MASASGGSTSHGSPNRARSRGPRRRDGCLTCRQRRVACPREKPRCRHCLRLHLTCSWPDEATASSTTQHRKSIPPAQPRTQTPNPPAASNVVISQPDNYSFTQDINTNSAPVNNEASGNGIFDNLASQGNYDPATLLFNEIFHLDDDSIPAPQDFFGGILDSDFNFLSPAPVNNTGQQNQMQEDDAFTLNPSQQSWNGPVSAVSSVAPRGESWDRSTITDLAPPGNVQSIRAEPRRVPVTVMPEDQPFIAHYLEHITEKAKIRDKSVPNHYLSLFSAGLFYPALYSGLLAWSAWILAQKQPPNSPDNVRFLSYSEDRHKICGTALWEGVSDPSNLDVDMLLPSILIYCQYEIHTGAGFDRLQGLLDLAKHLISRLPHPVTHLQPFTQRVACLLTSYDVRASMFGIRRAAYTLQIGEGLFQTDENVRLQLHGSNTELLRINFLTAKASCIDGDLREARRVSNTDHYLEHQNRGQDLYREVCKMKPIFDPSTLDGIATTQIGEVRPGVQREQQDTISPEVISRAFLAGLYNALLIYICRVLQMPAPKASIDRIISSSWNLYKSPADVTVGIFPRPLFFAAIETDDAARFDWIVERLAECSAIGEGKNIQKTRDLLMQIRSAEAGGSKKDLGMMLLDAGAHFVM